MDAGFSPTGYVMPAEFSKTVDDLCNALKAEGDQATPLEKAARIMAVGGKIKVVIGERLFEISRGRDGKLSSVEIVR